MNTNVDGSPDHEAMVAADPAGNVFYAWVARNRLPYLAVSRDGGHTWGRPLEIGVPGLHQAGQPVRSGRPGGSRSSTWGAARTHRIGTCGPTRCQQEFDFDGVAISHTDGAPWAVFIDGCLSGKPCPELGNDVLGRLVGGSPLFVR